MSTRRALIGCIAILLLTAVIPIGFDGSPSVAAAAGKTLIKIGNVIPATDILNVALRRFGELLAQKTNGQVEVQLFPASQLGGEVELTQQTSIGTLQVVATGVTGFDTYDLLFLPYVFTSGDHMFKVLRGEIGQQWADLWVKKANIRTIGYIERSPRNLTTAKTKVVKPQDAKGLKIRTPQVECMLATWEAVGAKPTPMAFPELFTSLQTGVIDGQENPVELIYNSAFFEVQKYLVLTKHVRMPFLIGMNEKFWKGLSPDVQKALNDSMRTAEDYARKLVAEQETDYLNKLKAKKMEVVEPDVAAFRSVMFDKVTKPYADKVWGAGIIEKIQHQ
jgi:TRAP-type transport system periplasmic protein